MSKVNIMNDFNFKSKIPAHWSSDKKKVKKFFLYAFGSAFFFALIGLGEVSKVILFLTVLVFIAVSFLLVYRTIFLPNIDDKDDESESVDDFINRI